jgi:hypothetical protein
MLRQPAIRAPTSGIIFPDYAPIASIALTMPAKFLHQIFGARCQGVPKPSMDTSLLVRRQTAGEMACMRGVRCAGSCSAPAGRASGDGGRGGGGDGGAAEDGIARVEHGGLALGYGAGRAVEADVQGVARQPGRAGVRVAVGA